MSEPHRHLAAVSGPEVASPGTGLALPTDPGELADETPAYAELPAEMWALPAEIAGDALGEVHDTLLAGLRRDAKHLPMGGLQAMLIERVAYYYVYIRFCDTHGWPGERAVDVDSGKRSMEAASRNRDATYRLWRGLVSDLNTMVYNAKISPEQLNAIVTNHTARVVARVARTLPVEQARPLLRKFAAVLSAEGE